MIGFTTILQGERTAIWRLNGSVRYIDGPRRMFLFREHRQPVKRFAAESGEYLIVRKKDGTTQHLPGPESVWFDPVTHLAIEIGQATKIDANEALVVYRREPDRVLRRILREPALFVPTPEEWVHELADMKLACELERTAKRQQMEKTEARHRNHLKQLNHEARLRQLQEEQGQSLASRRNEKELTIEGQRQKNTATLQHEQALHEEKAGYYARMRELPVNLTRYLVAQYQNTDKIIRIDNGKDPQLHMHEN